MQDVRFLLPDGGTAFVSFISRYRLVNDYRIRHRLPSGEDRTARFSKPDDADIQLHGDAFSLEECRAALAAQDAAEQTRFDAWRAANPHLFT